MKDKGTIITLLIAVAFICTLLFCPSLRAQTEVKFRLLPPGKALVLKDGTKARYYLLEEWLELAAADAELLRLRAEVPDLEALTKNLQGQLEAKEQEIASLEDDVETWKGSAERRKTKWEECEKARAAEAGGPLWPYFVAIAGAVVGIVGTTLYLSTAPWSD